MYKHLAFVENIKSGKMFYLTPSVNNLGEYLLYIDSGSRLPQRMLEITTVLAARHNYLPWESGSYNQASNIEILNAWRAIDLFPWKNSLSSHLYLNPHLSLEKIGNPQSEKILTS